MYFQEVLFKPSWILASERDVRLMDAFFFFFLVVHSKKHDTCLPPFTSVRVPRPKLQ